MSIDVLADTGMGTTPGMWDFLSEILVGEKLPDSLNAALYALRDGRAQVVPLESAPMTDERTVNINVDARGAAEDAIKLLPAAIKQASDDAVRRIRENSSREYRYGWKSNPPNPAPTGLWQWSLFIALVTSPAQVTAVMLVAGWLK